jgi:glycosyltransferase involved in cell wall biosynthesis
MENKKMENKKNYLEILTEQGKQLRLSFIVPCYNSEKFICKCLDSLYNQDIPETNYEIICVNECSPDSTRDIILEYQKQHQNLVLIDHEVNKMQGATRNTGLRAARGKYIWFVDPDDFIEFNCLNLLLTELETNDLDILNFDFYNYFEDGTTIPVSISETTNVVTGLAWLNSLTKNFDENASPWRKIFRTKLLIDNNFFFPARRYEDQGFSLFSACMSQKLKHLNRYVYFYLQNFTSTINERLTAINYISAIECGADYLEFLNKIQATDPVFAERIKMSGFWKIDFGSKEIPYFASVFRKRLIKCIMPHLELIQQSGYFKGFPQRYYRHFVFYNRLFFVFSPLLRFLRKIKKRLGKIKRSF